MQDNNQQDKDLLFGTKSAKVGPSGAKGGKQRVTLSIEQGTLPDLIATLEKYKGNEAGVKLDIHVTEKINSYTNVPFESAFFFIKPIGERPAGAGQGTGGLRAVPKNVEANGAGGDNVGKTVV